MKTFQTLSLSFFFLMLSGCTAFVSEKRECQTQFLYEFDLSTAVITSGSFSDLNTGFSFKNAFSNKTILESTCNSIKTGTVSDSVSIIQYAVTTNPASEYLGELYLENTNKNDPTRIDDFARLPIYQGGVILKDKNGEKIEVGTIEFDTINSKIIYRGTINLTENLGD